MCDRDDRTGADWQRGMGWCGVVCGLLMGAYAVSAVVGWMLHEFAPIFSFTEVAR